MKLYDVINSSGVYAIAEMSANHAGKLDNALEIVRAAKEAGADCLKIQTYTADTLTLDCNNEFFRIKVGLWDGYRLYDLYKEAYTPWEWHKAIKDECDKAGIDFLSTPFDKTAVDFLVELGVKFFKIASFELVDIPLIEYAASKGKPLVISCGMGSIDEIQDAVDACKRQGNDQIVLLKCCSEYPANYSDMNLAVIPDMRERFGVPVGLSDHSMGSLAAVVGVSLGACVIEKHFCLSREIENPDSAFSMEPNEFSAMISDLRTVIAAKGSVCYELSEREKSSTVFRRSLFASKDIEKGEIITEENVRCVRPGYGMKPKFYKCIIGKKAACDMKFGTPISQETICDGEFEDE
ncbi:MAG: pseudaminic acid synthase [Syntrophales bacterium]|nr:pseudaminic acid synthase [Syntrophales bacterium]